MSTSESEEYIPEPEVGEEAVRKRKERAEKRALLKQHHKDRVQALDKAAQEGHSSDVGIASDSKIEGSSDTGQFHLNHLLDTFRMRLLKSV